MELFICPVCGMPLIKLEHAFQCAGGHSYDIAKSGYVNLLSGRNSQHVPGDNKLMVNARRAFLEKGYYRPLSDAVCDLAEQYLPKRDSVLLDAGCGEGYYTEHVRRRLLSCGKRAAIAGIDISKAALSKAAKRSAEVSFAVASIFHTPLAENSCDLLLNLFAPYCGEEFARVLKQDGVMIMVIPGENHLWELKQLVYDEPYKNHVKDYALPRFELQEHKSVSYTLAIDSGQDLDNLFKMTPYYYKTGEENYKRILGLQSFCTQAAFELLVYRCANS